MKKYRTIWLSLAALILLGSVAGVLSWVNTKRNSVDCSKVNVRISAIPGKGFINEEDIRLMVLNICDSLLSKVENPGPASVEAAVETNPYVANAEVYRKLDGSMMVDVEQRRPVARVVCQNGESYYIDKTGELMPLSPRFSAFVPVVNGFLNEPYSLRRGFLDNDSVKTWSMLDDIYVLCDYIAGNSFWDSQIEQVFVTPEKEFELITRVGDQLILFGDTSSMAGKFKKLELFYSEALNRNGWNQYKSLNLKFRNQIICKK